MKINDHEFILVYAYDGTCLTDVDLLSKLVAVRDGLAAQESVSACDVYTNEQLVAIASFKPTTEQMYAVLSGFGVRDWERGGKAMVDAVIKHLDPIGQ